MGLNLCVGYTGLISFGHSTWFGIGAYAAGLIQLHWFHDQIWLPILLSMVVVAALSTAAGVLILRRRGVYFSLLTLALSALTYTVAFRWTEVTGGEDGLSGLKRGSIGPSQPRQCARLLRRGRADRAWRAVRAAARDALAVRARARGDPRKPAARHVPGLSRSTATSSRFSCCRRSWLASPARCWASRTYLVSAEAVSVPFSGELLAMVVIGGMHHILGPALGALFFILFRELFSIWTANWLLWFGLVFVGFVLFSPSGLVGIWSTFAGAGARRRKKRPR